MAWTISHHFLSHLPAGEMQKHYEHGVPKDAKHVGGVESKRIVLVFRHGTEDYVDRDTGLPLTTLLPRVAGPKYSIGRIQGLEEGSIYGRTALRDMGGHW
jgi:hypothetical protein